MKEYLKIHNIFKFDEKYRNITGLKDEYETLKNAIWEGTEKVDGTNIRIHWNGHNVEFAGRTDNAEIPKELNKWLEDTFKSQEMEYVLEQLFNDKDVILYGEGYGKKIQSGESYSDMQKFILFDIEIDGYYLTRNNVNDIADKLGLDKVSIVFVGTLEEAIEYVKKHNMSKIGDGTHEMEGIVLEPKGIRLYDNEKKPLKCKCKYRDILKAGLIKA